jgi:endonuclease G
MSESFFLSNMVPQVPNNTRGIWKQLETAVRGWVRSGRDIYVVSGTVYDPGYKNIGRQVGIPSRLFKVVIDAKSNTAIAFLMPNAALPVKDLPRYAVSIADVEAATGINFMPALPANNRIETEKPNLAAWPGL